jgi:hypothetical protein
MVRIVGVIVTVVFAGIDSELVAQKGESHVAKEVVAAPEPKDAPRSGSSCSPTRGSAPGGSRGFRTSTS